MNRYKDMTQVELDYCGQGCGGLWFDKKELGATIDNQTDFVGIENSLNTAKSTDYPCGNCPNQFLVRLQYHPDYQVEIDYCQACEGIFLDGGELRDIKNIIKAASPNGKRLLAALKYLESSGYKPLCK